MTLSLDDVRRPLPPASHYDRLDLASQYWRQGKDIVFLEGSRVAGADADSFRFFLGAFAMDAKRCYSWGSLLRGADRASFEPLNFTWCRDASQVWCLGGPVKDAHAASFEALDVGVEPRAWRVAPRSYGRDEARVFHYDGCLKAKLIKKADPATFVSLRDARFGADDRTVFSGYVSIAKAKREHWRPLGGFYSRDHRHAFYFNREIAGVDLASFRVMPTADEDGPQLARDDREFYCNSRPLREEDPSVRQALLAEWRKFAPASEVVDLPLR